MTTQKQYEPFGDEWFLEMKKWNKTMLIDLLRKTLMEASVGAPAQSVEQLKRSADLVAQVKAIVKDWTDFQAAEKKIKALQSDRDRLLVAVKEAKEMLLAKGVNDAGVGMAGINMLIKEMEP